ncbi:hypothetical protein ACFY94_08930 [Streptomyces griseorubiginosus]|uniref:hypothetical protein n=1 Tax=Streptomyces griseorubiginosus TaxID=67304 RepID=UPI0036F14953
MTGGKQWALDPLTGVGPLTFGMSPDEVSEALSHVTAESQRCPRSRSAQETVYRVEVGIYQEFGLKLYYRQQRLAGVVVDALRGPQVFADDTALVGRVPSVLEQWLVDRADGCEPGMELSCMAAGVPVSESLGVVIDVQRAGDHLLTRPVFVPSEAMDDLPHFLPASAWSRC